MHFMKSRKHDDAQSAQVHKTLPIVQKRSLQPKHNMSTLVPTAAESLKLTMTASQAVDHARHFNYSDTNTPPLTPGYMPHNMYYHSNTSNLPTPPQTPRNRSLERADSIASKTGFDYTKGTQGYGKAGFVLTVSSPRPVSVGSHPTRTTSVERTRPSDEILPTRLSLAQQRSHSSRTISSQTGETRPGLAQTRSRQSLPAQTHSARSSNLENRSQLVAEITSQKSSSQPVPSDVSASSISKKFVSGSKDRKVEVPVSSQKPKIIDLDRSVSTKSSSRFSWGWVRSLGKSKNSKEIPETITKKKSMKQMLPSIVQRPQKEQESIKRVTDFQDTGSQVQQPEKAQSQKRPLTSYGSKAQLWHNTLQSPSDPLRPATSHAEIKTKPTWKGKEKTQTYEDKPFGHDSWPIPARYQTASGVTDLRTVDSRSDGSSVSRNSFNGVAEPPRAGARTLRRFPSMNLDDDVADSGMSATDYVQTENRTKTQSRERHVAEQAADIAEPDLSLPERIQPINLEGQTSKSEPEKSILKYEKQKRSSSQEDVVEIVSETNLVHRPKAATKINAEKAKEVTEAKAGEGTGSTPAMVEQAGVISRCASEPLLRMPEIVLTRDDIPVKASSRPPSDRSVSTSKSVSFDPSLADFDHATGRIKPRSMKRASAGAGTSYHNTHTSAGAYIPSTGIYTRPKSTVRYMAPLNEQPAIPPMPKRLTAIEKQILQRASVRHLYNEPKERKLAGFDPSPASIPSETASTKSNKSSSPESKRKSRLRGVLSVTGLDRKSIDQSSISSSKSKGKAKAVEV